MMHTHESEQQHHHLIITHVIIIVNNEKHNPIETTLLHIQPIIIIIITTIMMEYSLLSCIIYPLPTHHPNPIYLPTYGYPAIERVLSTVGGIHHPARKGYP